MKMLILSLSLMLVTILPTLSIALAQMPEGTVTNSKYMTITEHRYRDQPYVDQITGTIVNNSTEEVYGVQAFVALYDSNDNLISMKFGGADVFTLPPGDSSAFSIIGIEKKWGVDHYVLYPGGTPT